MNTKKRLFWSLFSLLLAALSIWAVLSQNRKWSPAQLVESVREANPWWLAAAVCCTMLFVVLEGAGLCSILKAIGFRRPLSRGILYSTADIYFSAITPSATGGQPASAFFMVRDGIPTGTATAVLLVNLILYTLSVIVLGLGAIFTLFRLLMRLTLLSKLLIGVGFAVLTGMVVLFFALLRRGAVIFDAIGKLLRFLHRKKLIHRLNARLAKLEKARVDFDSCAQMTRGKTWSLLRAFFWNLGQRAAQIAVPMCLYLALGGRYALAGTMFSAQCLVTVGYNCVPVPGAMGVADYLMLDTFSELLGRDEAFRLEMLSRGLSFYLCVALCGLLTLIGYLLLRKKGSDKV